MTMNKVEFLDQLRQSLSGKVDAGMISDNLRYYEEYINSQLMQGKAETEVMATLGSPRLIARTILDANRVDAQEEVFDDQAQDASWTTRDQGSQGFQTGQGKMPWILKFFTLPRWLRGLISFGIFVLILAIFLCVLEFLAPVIALALITLFLVKLFRDWLH